RKRIPRPGRGRLPGPRRCELNWPGRRLVRRTTPVEIDEASESSARRRKRRASALDSTQLTPPARTRQPIYMCHCCQGNIWCPKELYQGLISRISASTIISVEFPVPRVTSFG